MVLELSSISAKTTWISRISTQVLQGSIQRQIPEQSVAMKAGARLLITISWPGKTNEKRHARYPL
jgi:hypothetical protein